METLILVRTRHMSLERNYSEFPLSQKPQCEQPNPASRRPSQANDFPSTVAVAIAAGACVDQPELCLHPMYTSQRLPPCLLRAEPSQKSLLLLTQSKRHLYSHQTMEHGLQQQILWRCSLSFGLAIFLEAWTYRIHQDPSGSRCVYSQNSQTDFIFTCHGRPSSGARCRDLYLSQNDFCDPFFKSSHFGAWAFEHKFSFWWLPSRTEPKACNWIPKQCPFLRNLPIDSTGSFFSGWKKTQT